MKDSLENVICAVICGLLTLGFTALFIHSAIKRNEGCILFFLFVWIFGSWTLEAFERIRKHNP